MTGIQSGKIIGNFKTLEEARKTAENTKGNESIAVKKDGTYTLISHDKDETKALIAANAEGRDTSSIVFGRQPKSDYIAIVELNIDGCNYDETIVINQPQTSKQEQLSEVGPKISDALVPGKLENKFKTLAEAAKAAEKIDGAQAIVKNKDDSYSLYQVTMEQVRKIQADKDYSGPVERFIGDTLEGREQVMRAREESMELLEPDYFGTPEDKKSSLLKLKEEYKKEVEYQTNGLQRMLLTGNSTISKEITVSDKHRKELGKEIEELNKSLKLFNEFSSGKVDIDPAKLADLQQKIDLFQSLNEQGKINISESGKKKLAVLEMNIERLNTGFARKEAATQAYNQSLDRTTDKVGAMQTRLDELKATAKTPEELKAVETLQAILDMYRDVLKNGSPDELALYESFMKRVQTYFDNQEYNNKPPVLLSDIMEDYNKARVILSSANKNNKIHQEDKQFVLDLMNTWGGKDSTEIKIVLQVTKGYKNSEEKLNIKEESAKTKLIRFYIAEPTIKNTKEIQKNAPAAFEIATRPGKDGKSYMDANRDFARTRNEHMVNVLEKQVADDEVKNALKEFFTAVNEVNDFMAMSELDLLAKKNSDRIIEEAINSFIREANYLESIMSLGVDASAASIADLLKKFREIITELDLDTRQLVFKKLNAQIIDKNFSKYIQDNQERVRKQGEAANMINNIFNESSEVKDPKLPLKLKELKIHDILKKMALVCLSE